MEIKVRINSLAIGTLCCGIIFGDLPALAEKPDSKTSIAAEAPIQLDDAALESASRQLIAAEAALEKEIAIKKQASVPSKKTPLPTKLQQAKKTAAAIKVKAPAAQPTLSNLSKEIAGEMESLHNKNTSLRQEVSSKTKSIADLNASNATLQSRLVAGGQRTEALIAKMKEMRNQLLMAETEISRLSSIIEDRNRTTLARYSGEMKAMAPLKALPPAKPTLLTRAQEEKASEDMPVATVMVENAQLRSGPGKNNSPLMAVSKGTRLVVEARLGEWYRVLAPTGSRAWIDAEIVAFAKDSHGTPTRTVKIQGYDTAVDKQAFEFIRSDMQR